MKEYSKALSIEKCLIAVEAVGTMANNNSVEETAEEAEALNEVAAPNNNESCPLKPASASHKNESQLSFCASCASTDGSEFAHVQQASSSSSSASFGFTSLSLETQHPGKRGAAVNQATFVLGCLREEDGLVAAAKEVTNNQQLMLQIAKS